MKVKREDMIVLDSCERSGIEHGDGCPVATDSEYLEVDVLDKKIDRILRNQLAMMRKIRKTDYSFYEDIAKTEELL